MSASNGRCFLPILTFDDRSLRPAFGYVFNENWLVPYESILSMLRKFVRANALSGAQVVSQIGESAVDGYEGLAPTARDVSVARVARLLAVRRQTVRQSMFARARADFEAFAWCSRCLHHGLHSLVHQMPRTASCPIHGEPIRRHCACCGQASRYWLDAQALECPFNCRHCGACLAAQGVVKGCKAMRLKDRQRIALAQARWA
jgi:hypothetical protein